ncbi:hypothetical protein QWY84_19430 [Aquisalimonas lutea]|uniref:hypothetical protein n=1 Tax=Aquisalimonas lutea TaxID=1327750 RepID=UPI0025B35140|nr:hypothetical protein [Aquisalimonas lutea]MDN3519783.1 hypothetical protein [Aquisalimonas lutea]
MRERTLPRFIDVEASGLECDSYPVEVAWSDAEGHVESMLIAPPEEWQVHRSWSEQAEALHGLTTEALLAEGTPIERVCMKLIETARTETLYSDAAPFDRFWIGVLLTAGGYPDHALRIVSADRLIALAGASPSHESVEAAKTQAQAKLGIGHHRAGDDVRALVEAYRLNRTHCDS